MELHVQMEHSSYLLTVDNEAPLAAVQCGTYDALHNQPSLVGTFTSVLRLI